MTFDKFFWAFVALIVAVVFVTNIGMFVFVPPEHTMFYSNATPLQMAIEVYTGTFTHFGMAHLAGNMAAFAIFLIMLLALEQIVIPGTGGIRRNDIFYYFVLCAFVVVPPLVSLDNLFMLKAAGDVGINGVSAGFSGVVASFMGFIAYGICRLGKGADKRMSLKKGRKVRVNFILNFIVMGIAVPISQFSMDTIMICVGTAAAHLVGFVFGFGLYAIMDNWGPEDLTPWLPKVFGTYNEGELQ